MALQSLVVLWDEILQSGNSFVIWRRCRGASRGGLELKWGFYVLIRIWLISRQHLWACIFILNLCHWYESIAWRRLISYNLDIVMLHMYISLSSGWWSSWVIINYRSPGQVPDQGELGRRSRCRWRWESTSSQVTSVKSSDKGLQIKDNLHHCCLASVSTKTWR